MRNKDRKIGQFMIAVGAIIKLKGTNKILLTKRASKEINFDEWEIMYGRIDQFEELSDALNREIFEETGLTNIKLKKLLRVWHIFRGDKQADNEVFGFTFLCESISDQVKLSDEHSEYRWVTPEEALHLIKVEGIRRDIEIYKNGMDRLGPVIFSDINSNETYY